MKDIERIGAGISIQTYRVTLEPNEMQWSDYRIITAVDRKGKLTDDEWDSIVGGAHPGHFGGSVRRYSNNKAEVKVYVD
jgi:hypothetical protein